MTSKEAVQEIINLANNLQIIPSTSTGQAVLMAIKSLEAWEKVKNDICEIDWYGDDIFWDGVNLVSDIIDKHLSEVSE